MSKVCHRPCRWPPQHVMRSAQSPAQGRGPEPTLRSTSDELFDLIEKEHKSWFYMIYIWFYKIPDPLWLEPTFIWNGGQPQHLTLTMRPGERPLQFNQMYHWLRINPPPLPPTHPATESQPLLLQGQGDLQVIYKNKEPRRRQELLLDLRYAAVPTSVTTPDWHLLHLEGDFAATDCRQLL